MNEARFVSILVTITLIIVGTLAVEVYFKRKEASAFAELSPKSQMQVLFERQQALETEVAVLKGLVFAR